MRSIEGEITIPLKRGLLSSVIDVQDLKENREDKRIVENREEEKQEKKQQ